jgi:uncharacterized protein (UPF0332 family)
MSLFIKSKENFRFVDMCFRSKKLCNIAINRAYYAVFQKIKHYLISKNFDYKSFLNNINLSEEREYSHRTLPRALKQCIKDNNPYVDFSPLVYIGTLHTRRKEVDYEDIMFDQDDLDDSHTEALTIINLMETLN